MSRHRVSGDMRATVQASHGPHKLHGGHIVEVQGSATPVTPASLNPLDFPKPWLYYGTNGFGNDLMGAQGVYDPGNFNLTRVNQVARFPLVTLNTHPFASTGPSDGPNRAIVSMLKAIRPSMKILWYDTLIQAIPYLTVGSQWKEMNDLSTGPPDVRFLYEVDGTLYPSPSAWFFDLGQVKAAALAIWLAHGGSAHDADGFFLDYAEGVYAFGSTVVDIGALGYSTLAQFNASAKAGLDYVVDGMKAQGFEVWGNGTADADSYARWTGRLFEGWDNAGGAIPSVPPFGYASFDAAMTAILAWQGSSATGDGYALLKSENTGTIYGSANWFKMQRYTLGCATVAGGYAYVGDNRNASQLATDDAEMWADEYSVVAGISEDTGAGIGWLGRPTEFGYKDGTSGLYVRHFDNGVVVANASATQKTIDLGTQYRRIEGVLQPGINDGSLVQSLTVPAKDARFLLRA